MSLNSRKDEDILNDLHSAQGRLNSSEIIDLETELKTNEMKEKIHRANMEKETAEVNKEQDTKREELMESLKKDQNLIYFDNKILKGIGEIHKDNVSQPEIKSAFLKYFQIDEKDVNPNNIEIVYDDDWKGITIKTKSIYEQLLLGERVKTKKENIIKNRDLISFAEKKSLEILDNTEQKEEMENILRTQGKEKAKEEMQNRVIKAWGQNISKDQEELLKTILINTGGGIKYSTTEEINGFQMEYPIKIGNIYVITMLDSKLSNVLPTFDGKEGKEVYQDILNHEYQHQETMTYKNGLLTGKIQGNPGEVPDPKNELECHLFYVKDEVISHLRNSLAKDRSIDFDAIEENLTRKTGGLYGYPGPFEKNTELMRIYTTKIKEYLQYVKENYLKSSIKDGKYYPSKEAISDMMKNLYEQGPNVKIE